VKSAIRFPGFRPVYGLNLLLLILLSGVVNASPLFEDSSVLEVTLAGPIGTLMRDARHKTYMPFSISTGEETLAAELRGRGHSRLKVCDFPPLRLNFPETPPANSIFTGQDKIKMVTHCRHSARGEQDLLEEYAAYLIFNVVTELSYRVRLLRVRYVDSDGVLSNEGESYFAFLIESKEEFAARTGSEPVSLKGFPLYRHDLPNAASMYVMQYLLGNTDYMMLKADYDEKCCHNVELFERDSKIISVPYDFDLAGLVNAGYARPDPKLRIRRVTQRLYRGLCTDRIYLDEAFDSIVSRSAEILAVPGEVPGLEQRNRERMAGYLNKFFDRAANKKKMLDSFERTCLDGY
jgi:hypothetical protein